MTYKQDILYFICYFLFWIEQIKYKYYILCGIFIQIFKEDVVWNSSVQMLSQYISLCKKWSQSDVDPQLFKGVVITSEISAGQKF